jgi:hypothetical protein
LSSAASASGLTASARVPGHELAETTLPGLVTRLVNVPPAPAGAFAVACSSVLLAASAAGWPSLGMSSTPVRIISVWVMLFVAVRETAPAGRPRLESARAAETSRPTGAPVENSTRLVSASLMLHVPPAPMTARRIPMAKVTSQEPSIGLGTPRLMVMLSAPVTVAARRPSCPPRHAPMMTVAATATAKVQV